ncbi:hypothetical protein, partial [Clostridium sp.]
STASFIMFSPFDKIASPILDYLIYLRLLQISFDSILHEMSILLSKIYGINITNTLSKEILVYLVSMSGFRVLSKHTVLGLYKTIILFAGALTNVPLFYIATFIY